MAKVVSANRLADGAVVYLGRDGAWVRSSDSARLFVSDDEAAVGLEAARQDIKRNLVVEPFIVEVVADAEHTDALSLRDKIRARGPTIEYMGKTLAKAEQD
jgi:hypothetical protein